MVRAARRAPSIDDGPPLVSARFPPGVEYADALDVLYTAAASGAELPAAVRIEPPLPREVTLVLPDRPDQGLRISLLAPWGWSGEKRLVRAPSASLPSTLTPREVSQRIRDAKKTNQPLPRGATLNVPDLEPCQVAHGEPEARPSC